MPILIARDPESCRRTYVLTAPINPPPTYDMREMVPEKKSLGYPVSASSLTKISLPEVLDLDRSSVSNTMLDVFEKAPMFWPEAGGAPTATQVFQTSVKLDGRTSGMQCDARGGQPRSYILRSACMVDITQAPGLSAAREAEEAARSTACLPQDVVFTLN